jgi:hypothetical protein
MGLHIEVLVSKSQGRSGQAGRASFVVQASPNPLLPPCSPPCRTCCPPPLLTSCHPASCSTAMEDPQRALCRWASGWVAQAQWVSCISQLWPCGCSRSLAHTVCSILEARPGLGIGYPHLGLTFVFCCCSSSSCLVLGGGCGSASAPPSMREEVKRGLPSCWAAYVLSLMTGSSLVREGLSEVRKEARKGGRRGTQHIDILADAPQETAVYALLQPPAPLFSQLPIVHVNPTFLHAPNAESDQSTPRLIDSGLASILSLVAQAKGWSQEEVGGWRPGMW